MSCGKHNVPIARIILSILDNCVDMGRIACFFLSTWCLGSPFSYEVYIYMSYLCLPTLCGISAQRDINYPDRQLALANDFKTIPQGLRHMFVKQISELKDILHECITLTEKASSCCWQNPKRGLSDRKGFRRNFSFVIEFTIFRTATLYPCSGH